MRYQKKDEKKFVSYIDKTLLVEEKNLVKTKKWFSKSCKEFS